MFDWLFEGRSTVYGILAVLTAIPLIAWRRTRKRWLLLGVVVAAGLIGLYALFDRTVETDREQIVRKVHALADAVNGRDLDALFVNISDQFRSPSGKSKAEFRHLVKGYLDSQFVERVKIWDIVCMESPSRDKATVAVFFSAKAEGTRDLLADCDAVFDYDARHGWRLRSIRLLKPQTTEEWSIQL